jgi:hypothetical protein
MTETAPLTLTIYPEDHKSFGPCECCGEMTSRVWGYVNRLDEGVAAYFVEWTPGHKDGHANFDLIVGKWGDGQDSSTRQAVSLEFRKLPTGPAFMVVDASSRSVSHSTLISRALRREDVIGASIASHAFAICDVIFVDDPRLAHLRS